MAYYNLEDIKKELDNKIDWYKTIIKAWENVTYPTKKDGNPFKTLSKNIQGAKLYSDSPSSEKIKLMVTAHSETNGYISDTIYCYDVYARTITNQIYIYNLKDIKEAVADRITLRKEELESLKYQRENAEKVYCNFRKVYDEAVKKLAEESKKDKNATLYYAVLNTIKSRYPYC